MGQSRLFYSCLLLLLTLIGCGPSNKLVLLSKDPQCKTVIEGEYITPQYYKYYAPAILFPDNSKYRYELGSVTKRDSNGIYFVAKKQGVFHHPDTVFYSYDKIRAIVDSTNYCVYGTLKENEVAEMGVTFSLEKIDDPKYTPIFLELKPNIKFAYCIEPGQYKVTKISQVISSEKFYESFPQYYFSFEVLPNSANYFGSFKLKDDSEISDSTLRIPYYEQHTGKTSGAAAGFAAGFIGSAIAGAITSAQNNSLKDKVKGYFNFDVQHLKDYKTDSNNELKKCPLVLNRTEIIYDK